MQSRTSAPGIPAQITCPSERFDCRGRNQEDERKSRHELEEEIKRLREALAEAMHIAFYKDKS